METKIYTREELTEKLASLPPQVRGFIYSPLMGTLVQQIGNKFTLHIDQIGALETSIVNVILDAASGDDLVSNITEALTVDEEKAAAIATEVNTLIFDKIRHSMQQASTVPETQENDTSIAPALPPKKEYPGADILLTEKTITMPLAPSPQVPTTTDTPPAPHATPRPYTTDPYREQPEQ